jgi:IstB-like ATP binding protein
LCLIGDSGTGKTHLLIGIGTAAAEAGYRVRYVLASRLVNELAEATTTAPSPRSSPATAGSTCSASMNSATSNSTGAEPTTVPSPDRTRREDRHRHRVERAIQRLDQNLHRPPPLRRHRRPPHLRRHHHRNRHHQLPTRPHPPNQRGHFKPSRWGQVGLTFPFGLLGGRHLAFPAALGTVLFMSSGQRRGRLATNTFVALLVISFYYLAYRYPFQINDSGTSPTYRDTPSSLQMGKYALIGLVLVAAVVVQAQWVSRRELIRRPFVLTHATITAMAVFALFKGALVGYAQIASFSAILIVGAVLASLALRWGLDHELLARHVRFYAIASIVALVIQLGLYKSTGRLPALAYADSVSVRFGAIIDDPNGFAFLIALLLPASWIGWKTHPRWRIVICVALATAILLTQSMTGAASTVIALFVGGLLLRWRSPGRATALIWTGLGLSMAVWIYLPRWPVFLSVLQSKSNSIAIHQQSIGALISLSPSALLGFGSIGVLSESGYVATVEMFGLPFALAYAALGVVAVFRLTTRIRSADSQNSDGMDQAFLIYLIAYLIGMFNLKLCVSFPDNLLYILGISLSLFRPELDRNRSGSGAIPRVVTCQAGEARILTSDPGGVDPRVSARS